MMDRQCKKGSETLGHLLSYVQVVLCSLPSDPLQQKWLLKQIFQKYFSKGGEDLLAMKHLQQVYQVLRSTLYR